CVSHRNERRAEEDTHAFHFPSPASGHVKWESVRIDRSRKCADAEAEPDQLQKGRARSKVHVAMTRAKDTLHLVVPQRFFTHGQHAQATATSMRPEPGSFPIVCSGYSKGRPGRWR